MHIFSLLSLSSAILALVLGLVVYFRSTRNWLSFIFLLFGMSLALLNLSQFQMRVANNFSDALVWSKIFGIWSIVLAFSVHFTSELTRKKKKSAIFYLLLYLPGVIIFYVQLASNYLALPPVEKEWGWAIQYNYGPFHNLAAGYGIFYWLLTVYFVTKYFKSAKGIIKRQARLIFIGYSFDFIVTITTDFLFPIFKINFPALGAAADIFTLALVAYAIWKYQMFTMDRDSIGGKLFHSISNYLIITDHNGAILEANQNFLSKLGYTLEDILGKRITTLLDNDKFKPHNPFYQYKTKNSEFKNKDIYFKSNSGESLLSKFSASFIKLEGSSSTGIIYLGEEQNENPETKRLRKTNEKQIEFLAESALDLVNLKTKEEVYNYIGEKTYNLVEQKAIIGCTELIGIAENISWQVKSIFSFGKKLEQLSSILGFDIRNFSASTNEGFISQLTSGKLNKLEFDLGKLTDNLISSSTGEKAKALFGLKELFVIPIQYGDQFFGALHIATTKNTPSINKELIETFMSIVSTVLNKQYAEIQLAKSENLFRTIVENSQIAIFIIDAEEKFTFIEGRQLYRLGVQPEKLIGKTVFEEFTEFPFIIKQIRKALQGNTFREIINIRGLLYFNVSFTPIMDENGKVNSIICMADDITFRMQSEKKLENLTEMQSKIFRVMGHDLKSPIANIISYSNLLLSDFESFNTEEIKKFTTNMQRSAENSYQILENIIEWSKTISKETPIKRELICLNNKVLAATEQVSPLANKKSIEIINSIEQPVTVKGDRNMIITILRNLLSNSIKFTHPHGRIEINARKDDKNIYLSIADNGIGMLPEQAKNLFVLKTNTTSRGTEGEPGSGLGLQITKDFMNKNEGKIEVSSQLNEGSIFTLSFPRPKDIEHKKIKINPN